MSKEARLGRRRFVLFGLGTLGVSALAVACGGPPAAPTQAPGAATPAESKPAEAPKPTEAPKPAAAEPTKPAAAAPAATKPAEPAKAAEPTKPAVAPAAKPGASKAPITLRFTTWWVPLEQGLKGAADKL